MVPTRSMPKNNAPRSNDAKNLLLAAAMVAKGLKVWKFEIVMKVVGLGWEKEGFYRDLERKSLDFEEFCFLNCVVLDGFTWRT